MQWCLDSRDTHFKDPNTYQLKHSTAPLKHLKHKRTAIDVGAHIGIFTRRYATQFQRVIAIEPLNHTYLKQNTHDLNNVEIIAKGCSNKEETLIAHNPLLSNSGAWELHSRAQTNTDTITIETITIDSLELTDVDLIKVDTQGMESSVVEGAIETLKHSSPIVQLELPCRLTQEMMQDLGYKCIEKVGKDWLWGVYGGASR